MLTLYKADYLYRLQEIEAKLANRPLVPQKKKVLSMENNIDMGQVQLEGRQADGVGQSAGKTADCAGTSPPTTTRGGRAKDGTQNKRYIGPQMEQCDSKQLTSIQSQHGLSGVPAALQHLREAVGLAGEPWETMGSEWKSLAALWLRTETFLSKASRTDLSFDEIRTSDIPEEWKDWMYAKLMKTDASLPKESFGQVFTQYLGRLPSSVRKVGGTVMKQIWCRPGKTGIIGLLLCLHWQAEFAGAGHDWMQNIRQVTDIFNAILSEPGL